jgi:hypothetical protein
MGSTQGLNCGVFIALSLLTKRPSCSSLVTLWCLMRGHISRAQKKNPFLSRRECQIHLLPRQIPRDHRPTQKGPERGPQGGTSSLANNCDYLLECPPLHHSWLLGNKEWSALSIGTFSLRLTQNSFYNQNIHVTPVKKLSTSPGLGANQQLVTDEPVEFEK